MIRDLRPGDAEALLGVFRDAVRRGAADCYSPDQLRAWAPDDMDLAAWCQRVGGKRGWVAEVEGCPVGFIDLTEDGLVDMLFVASDHHRSGIASRLYAALEAAARVAGMMALRTEASLKARPFFEAQGFAVTAAQQVSRGGQVLANFRMEKRLT